MVERSDYMLGAEVFACLKTRNMSIEMVTKKIYGNDYAKNVVRVYQCIVAFMSNDLVIPKFQNRTLLFGIKENGCDIK